MVARMKELSVQYPRYGYRRMRIWPGVTATAGGRAGGAAQTAEEAPCRCSAATASAVRPEPGLSYDLLFDHCDQKLSPDKEARI